MSVTGQASPSVLTHILDYGITPSIVIAVLLLIKPGLQTIAVDSVSASGNLLTLAGGINHFELGTRVRLSAGSGGVLPAPLLTSQDYYVALGMTVGEVHLCLTLNDALGSINFIDLTDSGSLPLNILEQPLDRNSPITQIVKHEIDPAIVPGYERKPIEFSLASEGVNKASKQPIVASWSIGSTALDYSAWAIIWSGELTPGDGAGTGIVYASDGVTRTIAANDTGGVTVNVSLLN